MQQCGVVCNGGIKNCAKIDFGAKAICSGATILGSELHLSRALLSSWSTTRSCGISVGGRLQCAQHLLILLFSDL